MVSRWTALLHAWLTLACTGGSSLGSNWTQSLPLQLRANNVTVALEREDSRQLPGNDSHWSRRRSAEDQAPGSGATSGRQIMTLVDAKSHKNLVDAGTCVIDIERTERVHCFPSLICIGAMKAGTYELKSWLEEHPLVQSASKEVHFFGHGRAKAKWLTYIFHQKTAREWTMPLESAKRGVVTFEKTPFYLASAQAAQEMAALLPSVKLVAILREPNARAYSSFQHHCMRNQRLVESKGTVVFNEDCAKPEMCCCGPLDNPAEEVFPVQCTPKSFHKYLLTAVADPNAETLGTVLRKGLYAKQLKVYIELFSRQQLFVVDSALFIKTPHEVMATLFEWLGMSPHKYASAYQNEAGYWVASRTAKSKSNTGKSAKVSGPASPSKYEPMMDESTKWLERFHQQPNKDLAALLPDVRFSWLGG